MQIEITPEESEALLLQEPCREFCFEIAHTDHREYKRPLVHRLELMEDSARSHTARDCGNRRCGSGLGASAVRTHRSRS
jgi:hypothetical protein